jgi:hypothetical protein
MIADEVLKRDEERRRRRDEGEEDEEAMESEPAAPQVQGDVKPKVVAKTRVSLSLTWQWRDTDGPAEVHWFRSGRDEIIGNPSSWVSLTEQYWD